MWAEAGYSPLTMSGTGLYCSNCGQLNDAEATFCSRCGAPQRSVSSSSGAAATAPTPAPVAPVAAGQTSGYSAPASPPGYSSTYGGSSGYAPAASYYRGYGGFWIRVLAAIIDAIVVGVVVLPLRIIFMGIPAISRRSVGPDVAFVFAGAFFIIAFQLFANWIYEAGLESSKYQATLGKMALGMQVTDLNGQRISFGRATGRHFAKIISGMILLIGYIMVGLTERKQGLHDMLAGTLVVKK